MWKIKENAGNTGKLRKDVHSKIEKASQELHLHEVNEGLKTFSNHNKS